jgi:spore coat protein U-like protein
MKNILTLILSSLLLIIAPAIKAQTHSTTASPKATATLAATCTISVQNVNFGIVSLPIGAQSASSNMTVQCSKSAPYTVALAYGGIYGQGSPVTSYWVHEGCPQACMTNWNWYYQYNTSGQFISQQQFQNVLTNGSLDLSKINIPGATWNATTQTYQVKGTAYGYGKMIGAAKGDNIAYYIQVPNNSSAIWNAGNSNYQSAGTGANQTIPVVATLVPGQTTNSYPTADTYLDVVTATISY